MTPELCGDNAAEWLARHNMPSGNVRFSELGGGISNKVVLAEGAGLRVVLKQSLGTLRTQAGWQSDRERIFREAAAMRWMEGKVCKGGRIPSVLFEDPATFTFAMTAAPPDASMWKTRLFQGDMSSPTARLAGRTLGFLICASWNNVEAERLFGDPGIFHQLRLDPYYRATADTCSQAAGYIDVLIERSTARRVSLVHGDWSPKNLLVSGDELWVIDWEVIHYGDPSFDVGFLLNHLAMKSIAMPNHRTALLGLAREFLGGLAAELPAGANWIVPAALEHFPALLLARVHGKSPAEYLDAAMRRQAAALALELMHHPAASVEDLFPQ